MAGKTLIVGCRLPNGITLENPLKPGDKITLNGLNKSNIVGAPYATTEVDADFWAAWKEVFKDFQPLKSGAIFSASGERDASDKAKELAGEKTGFESVKAEDNNVKQADKE